MIAGGGWDCKSIGFDCRGAPVRPVSAMLLYATVRRT